MVATSYPAADAVPAAADRDFSLVLGGPLFQLLRRIRLADGALGLLHRRVIAAVLITWTPLVVLSALDGGLVGGGRTVPFIIDVGVQLRFLVVVPMLLAAELLVHRRMQLIVGEFAQRNLVPPHHAQRFDNAVEDSFRLRNSVLAEVLIVGVVYAAGVVFTPTRYAVLGEGAWYASTAAGHPLSPAGVWLVFVSLPVIQFLILRWYFRLFIWVIFLWRVSLLDLDLNAIHPDKAGGLGFLSESLSAFAPLVAAQGVLVAGVLADRIFFAGARFTEFETDLIGGAIVLVLLFGGPLMLFAPRLAHVKRAGLRDYGTLAQSYVRDFRGKWLRPGAVADEPLLASGDIQSLADFGNSFGGAESMRIIPIRPTELLYFLAAFLLPVLPLTLTMMSAEKILERVVGLLF